MALARDRRVHSGFLEAAHEPDHRRRCALGLLAAVVLDDQQHRPVSWSRSTIGIIKRSWIGRLVCSLSGPRYNGVVLPGDGFKGDAANSPLASDPAISALFRGVAARYLRDACQCLRTASGLSYALNARPSCGPSAGIFHNRVTLNDSTLLGGNVPFQPQATIENGSVDNPGGTTVGGANLPFAITAQDPVFKHPTVLHVVGRGAA